MPESLYIPFTEITSLTMFLLILYWLRRTCGIIPMYLTLGLFFVFGQLTLTPVLGKVLIDDTMQGTLGYGLLLLPVVEMYLVIYEEEGTLQAQRLLFGLLMSVVAFCYITQLMVGQFKMDGDNTPPEFIQILLDSKTFLRPFLLMTAAHLAILLLLPVSYQLLRNWHIPAFAAMFLHICTFVAFSMYMQTIIIEGERKAMGLNVIVSWVLALAVTCLMTHTYIQLATSRSYGRRGPLGMLSSLFYHLQTASRMRQTVEEWEDRYQIVFDNAIEMIYLVNSSGAVLNANRSAVEALGSILYQSGCVITNRILNEKNEPLNWEETWYQIWKDKENEQTSFTLNNMILKAKGDVTLNVNVSCSPAKLDDKEMAVLIMKDTTRQKAEERERQKLQEQLIHSQRMEAVGVLAGGVAHDFNNLILGIQSSAEILGRQQLDPTSKSMLDIIDNASRRAADLTSKLLGFARKGKYQEELLDLRGVAQNAAELFNIGLKDINFKFLSQPAPLMVKGDQTQLQQVFLNLLLNARDALEPGDKSTRKITLRLDRVQDDMEAWTHRPESATNAADYIVARVKDTGKGMSQETMAHIFEPFFTTKGHNGTGLGLSMVYGCITHHNGWLHVTSEPGKGCTVYIFLPAAN